MGVGGRPRFWGGWGTRWKRKVARRGGGGELLGRPGTPVRTLLTPVLSLCNVRVEICVGFRLPAGLALECQHECNPRASRMCVASGVCLRCPLDTFLHLSCEITLTGRKWKRGRASRVSPERFLPFSEKPSQLPCISPSFTGSSAFSWGKKSLEAGLCPRSIECHSRANTHMPPRHFSLGFTLHRLTFPLGCP